MRPGWIPFWRLNHKVQVTTSIQLENSLSIISIRESTERVFIERIEKKENYVQSNLQKKEEQGYLALGGYPKLNSETTFKYNTPHSLNLRYYRYTLRIHQQYIFSTFSFRLYKNLLPPCGNCPEAQQVGKIWKVVLIFDQNVSTPIGL